MDVTAAANGYAEHRDTPRLPYLLHQPALPLDPPPPAPVPEEIRVFA